MRVVTPRSLPADLPKSAIPGIMKPTMIRGIVKPKKLPKIELNVAKILTILGKLRFPITIPKIRFYNKCWGEEIFFPHPIFA